MQIVARNRYLTTDGHTAHVSFKDGNGHWCGWIEGQNGNVRPASWYDNGVETDYYPDLYGRSQNIVGEWRKLHSFTAWVGVYGVAGGRPEIRFTSVKSNSPYAAVAELTPLGGIIKLAIAPVVIEPGQGTEFLNGWKKENDK